MRLIDADELKEYIHNQDGRPFIGITIGEAFQMMVDEQPTIEERKTGKWIPCSERLPSEDGEYLVTRYAGYLPKKIIIDIAIYCRIRREWQKAYPVIAWMPLPKPPKEGDE